MSKFIRPPDDIQIASMNVKKAAIRDPMMHGSGTPWEDRGSLGMVGAYFKTVGQSLLAPAKLLGSIRRPETFTDARAFALASGIAWGVGLGIICFLDMRRKLADINNYDVEPNMYYLGIALQLVLAPFVTLLMVNIVASIFSKMVSSEMKGRNAPLILMKNLFAYTTGPGALAVVPIVGPALAGVWIFVTMMVAGRSRLQLGFASTFTAVLFASIAVTGLSLAMYYVGWFAFATMTGAYVYVKPTESFLGI